MGVDSDASVRPHPRGVATQCKHWPQYVPARFGQN